MAKKTREVDYRVCDECEIETRYVNECCLCSKELCHTHSHASPIGAYYFCKDCFSDKFKKEYSKFTKNWNTLKEKHDEESEEIIREFEIDIKMMIIEAKKS